MTLFLKERFNREERVVFNEIENHRGRGDAISVPILTRCVHIRLGEFIPEIKIRKIVRDLTVKHGMPIGSATNKPPGYFIITNKKELKRAVKSIRKRGIENLVRASKLESTGRKMFTGQLELELPEKTP